MADQNVVEVVLKLQDQVTAETASLARNFEQIADRIGNAGSTGFTKAKEALDAQGRALSAALDPLEAYSQRVEKLDELYLASSISAKTYVDALERAKDELNGTTAAAESAAKQQEALERQGRALAASVDPQERLNQEVERAVQLYTAGAISADTYALAIEKAGRAFKATEKVTPIFGSDGPLPRGREQVDGLGAAFDGLKGRAAAAVTVVVALAAAVSLFNKTMEASRDAEDALVKFDIAFRNLGRNVKVTREDILEFADDASKVTIFDDETILRAQTALLKFRTVSGDTFTRVRQAAIDMASALGQDLTQAAETVGRAIERPDLALRQLRQAGVYFTQSQEKTIKSLVETGRRGEAAAIVLGELEKRFKGAGDAVSKTLNGSLAKLKTAFDNLFEVDTGPLTTAIAELTRTLEDPEVVQSLKTILGFMVQLVSWAVQFVNALAQAANWLKEIAKTPFKGISDVFDGKGLGDIGDLLSGGGSFNPRQFAGVNAALEEGAVAARDFFDQLDQVADLMINDIVSGVEATDEAFTDLGEVMVKVFKTSKGAMEEFYDSLDENTATEAEKGAREFYKFEAALDELFAHRRQMLDDEYAYGVITWEQYNEERLKISEEFNKRFKEKLDDSLEEVKVSVKKEYIPAIKTPFDVLVDQVSSALDRMLNNGKFSFRELGLYLLREVLSGAIRKALNALAAGIKAAFSQNGGGWGGFFGSLAGAFSGTSGTTSGGGGFVGPRAGGGLVPRAGAWVGENGAEFVMAPGARVYNKNQMRAMGWGGGTTISVGGTSIIVQGNADDRVLSLIKQYVDVSNARQSRETLRVLQRNGLRSPT